MTKMYKLANHVTNNVHVEFDFDNTSTLKCVRLVSYHTTILEIKNDFSPDVWIKVKHPVNCSRTTARHINWFTINFFGKNLYYDLKATPVDGFLPMINAAESFKDSVRWYNDNAVKFYW